MKNQNIILKEYLKKIKLLKSHNKSYFIDDSPKVSDASYDKLKKQILEIEKKYPFILKKLIQV